MAESWLSLSPVCETRPFCNNYDKKNYEIIVITFQYRIMMVGEEIIVKLYLVPVSYNPLRYKTTILATRKKFKL